MSNQLGFGLIWKASPEEALRAKPHRHIQRQRFPAIWADFNRFHNICLSTNYFGNGSQESHKKSLNHTNHPDSTDTKWRSSSSTSSGSATVWAISSRSNWR